MNYETEREIQIGLARYFDYRKCIIVPNVSWGMFSDRECDLIVMRSTGYLAEVEIKISVADLKKDLEKHHHHFSFRIKELYFAMPEKMVTSCHLVPEHAGIIIMRKGLGVDLIRKAEVNKQARALTDKEQFKLARLGAIRVWPLIDRLQLCNKRD
jgi:hypothetical protein